MFAENIRLPYHRKHAVSFFNKFLSVGALDWQGSELHGIHGKQNEMKIERNEQQIYLSPSN